MRGMLATPYPLTLTLLGDDMNVNLDTYLLTDGELLSLGGGTDSYDYLTPRNAYELELEAIKKEIPDKHVLAPYRMPLAIRRVVAKAQVEKLKRILLEIA